MSAGNSMALDGPFELTMQVHLIGEGDMAGNTAKADISLPLGNVPTAEDIVRLANKVLETAGPDFRLPTRHEFLQNALAEQTRTNIKFAVPGPDSFNLSFGGEPA